jgi:hypothetical protein
VTYLAQEITLFPNQIKAGLTFRAEVYYPDYPASDWTLAAIIRGQQNINLNAVASGDNHLFESTALITAAWLPGRYSFSVRATSISSGDIFEAQFGELEILPDLLAISGEYDGRSDNQKALDAIEAVLARRATLDQQRYTINNRELWRTPIIELIKLRSFYAAAVAREKRKNSGNRTFGRRINVRFS